MGDQERITHLIDELQSRLSDLKAEVQQLQKPQTVNTLTSTPGSTSTSPQGIARALGADVSDELRELGNLILPTATGEPDAIFGGTHTDGFPDCCAVGDDQRYFCTGTLIAPNVVVSARHCTERGLSVTRVFLKGDDISSPETGETLQVLREIPHPDPNVDLLVLVLRGNSTVRPRHVAQGAEAQADMATLVGFGTIDFSGRLGYGTKRMVEVPIVSLSCDSAGDANTYGCHAGFEMVAGHRGLRRDSCQGDSGGPLYIRTVNGDYYLLGATLRGAAGTRGCGDGGIYLRVDKFLDWIQEQTGVEIEGPLE